MRVRPILFNTEMVRAVLDGRKTVTRRVVKFPVNKFTGKTPMPDNISAYRSASYPERICFLEEPYYCVGAKQPYYPGDILYVRETWQKAWLVDDRDQAIEGTEHYYYLAGPETPQFDFWLDPDTGERRERMPWKSSIHMPKEAARVWLKVKDVRVERLRDIDDNGILAEGLEVGCYFEDIWNSTIKKTDRGKYGWEANPWVWVINFERCGKPAEEQ